MLKPWSFRGHCPWAPARALLLDPARGSKARPWTPSCERSVHFSHYASHWSIRISGFFLKSPFSCLILRDWDFLNKKNNSKGKKLLCQQLLESTYKLPKPEPKPKLQPHIKVEDNDVAGPHDNQDEIIWPSPEPKEEPPSTDNFSSRRWFSNQEDVGAAYQQTRGRDLAVAGADRILSKYLSFPAILVQWTFWRKEWCCKRYYSA